MGGAESVLVVGAGCVGQVFAKHLVSGGATLTFFVREQHRAEVERGLLLYRLRGKTRRPVAERFAAHAVITQPEQVAARRFDQVYVTLASSSLGGAWLPALASAIGDATLVSLQPRRDDMRVIEQAGVRPEAIVSGSIALMAYTAPLAGETRFDEPGTAYWLPPLARSPFSGEGARTRRVVRALRRGGLPATTMRDVHRAVAFPNALGMVFLTALEASGWSMEQLAHGPLLSIATRAMREVVPIVADAEGRPPLGLSLLTREHVLRAGFWLGQRLAPFPLEPYLQKHFTKVGAQTRLMVTSLFGRGRAQGQPVDALGQLIERLPVAPSH